MEFSITKLFANSTFLFSGTMGSAMLSLAQSIIVARYLGASGYGLLALTTSLPNLIFGLLGFRSIDALSFSFTHAKAAGDRGLCQRLLSSSLIADTVSACGTIAACYVASVMDYLPTDSDMLPEMILTFSFTFLATPFLNHYYAVLREAERYKLLASLPLVSVVLRFGFVLSFFAIGNFSPLAVIWGYCLASLCEVIIYISLVSRELSRAALGSYREIFRNVYTWNLGATGGFWQAMRSSYLSGSLTIIVKNGDVALMGLFAETSALGHFRIAKQLLAVGQSVANNLAAVAFQDFNHYLRPGSDRAVLRSAITRISVVWIPCVAVGALCVALCARVVIEIVYGPEFSDAAEYLTILVGGLAVVTSLFWAQPMAQALGGWSVQTWISLVAVLTFVATSFILGPWWGAYGVATAVAASWIVATFLFTVYSIHQLRELRQ